MENLMIRAERPWRAQADSPLEKKRGRQIRDAQKKIDRCMSCTAPPEACTGQAHCRLWEIAGPEEERKPEPPAPREDPCLNCWSRAICEAHKGTCGERERYRAGKREGALLENRAD